MAASLPPLVKLARSVGSGLASARSLSLVNSASLSTAASRRWRIISPASWA